MSEIFEPWAVPDAPAPGHATLLTEEDLYLFNEGSHVRLYRKLGAHAFEHGGRRGTYFGVWAQNAAAVSVMGDFNHWRSGEARLAPRGAWGIWVG
jgi:1,4-alpha-glucan branching enzyme